jgi:hypothetical protein
MNLQLKITNTDKFTAYGFYNYILVRYALISIIIPFENSLFLIVFTLKAYARVTCRHIAENYIITSIKTLNDHICDNEYILF